MFLRLRPMRPGRDRSCRECGAESEGTKLQLTVFQPRLRRNPKRWGHLGQTASCCMEDGDVRRQVRIRAEDGLARLGAEFPDCVESIRDELDRLLPPPEAPPALDDLGLDDWASADDVRKAYHARARAAHPDVGGDPEAFDRLNQTYQEALGWVALRDRS